MYDYGMDNEVLLADIGNTHFHVYNGRDVEHLLHEDALVKYAEKSMYYISVKAQLEEKISRIKLWKNISENIKLPGAYNTMGVDRQALCLSRQDGIYVDAGSAITVDMMQDGQYLGGFIFPGLKAMLEAYRSISPALNSKLNENISLETLPVTTKDGISYGIIASIKALIDKHRDGKNLYFTGGDGKLLSTFFKGAIYDDTLVFDGMRKVIKSD